MVVLYPQNSQKFGTNPISLAFDSKVLMRMGNQINLVVAHLRVHDHYLLLTSFTPL
jgi:hypothetical protein